MEAVSGLVASPLGLQEEERVEELQMHPPWVDPHPACRAPRLTFITKLTSHHKVDVQNHPRVDIGGRPTLVLRAGRLIGYNRPAGWLRAFRAPTSSLILLAGVKWSCSRIYEPAFPPHTRYAESPQN